MTGPSSTPADVVEQLTAHGLERESESGLAILLLTQEPTVRPSAFEVRLVGSFDEHVASILVGNEGFGFSPHDAEDEVRRAGETFAAEHRDAHVCRLLAYDDDRPVAVARAWFAPQGIYIGGSRHPVSSRQGRDVQPDRCRMGGGRRAPRTCARRTHWRDVDLAPDAARVHERRLERPPDRPIRRLNISMRYEVAHGGSVALPLGMSSPPQAEPLPGAPHA